MSLAEGVQARVAYKFYTSGVMQTNSQPVSSTDPGPSGGQVLRRVGSTLKLAKDTYQSAEIRTDRQIVDMRHGTRRVTGSISGEFSPGTYSKFLEAALRGTAEPVVTSAAATLTSAACDNALSTITFGGGDPVVEGFRVGQIMEFTGLTDPDNNNKNFIILGFSGASNRTLTVYPAPDTMAAALAFTVTSRGKRLYMPSTGFVQRKVAIEEYHSDIDLARLYIENRVAGFNIGLPASGMSTIEFPMMGRDMEVFEQTQAPFFTAPLPETTAGIMAAVNGLLQVSGRTVGVVTGITLQMDLSPSSDAVVGQDFVPEVFLGSANITGQITADLEDGRFFADFLDEEELSILAFFTTTSAPDADAVSIFLPRIKLTDADVPLQGMGAQVQTMPFQALKYVGTDPGVQQTTIQICDTLA
jgi:hypothetical protein